MPGAPDALQKGAYRTCRADLANQIDIADVDTQLERRRGDQCSQLAAFQSLLRIESLIARKAAVMRSNVFTSDSLGQMTRGALGKPAVY